MLINYNYKKNDIERHKAFTMVELLLVLGAIGIVAVLSISLMKSIPTFRVDAYTQKYCELLDGAVTSAASANGLTDSKSTTLIQIAPYLRGNLANENTKIVMSDGSEITGGNTEYSVTFPKNIGNHTYTITNGNGLDCVTGAVPGEDDGSSQPGWTDDMSQQIDEKPSDLK